MRKLIMTVAVVLTVAAAGCTASGTGQPGGPSPAHSVAPSGGATDGPPPLPDVTRPAPPPRALTTPVAGGRDRTARWTWVGQADGGRVLLLDVTVGGPPCDAVTAIDVAEGPRSVRITVYAGVASSAACPSGVPALVGTVRVPARLAAPVGSRTVLGGGG